MRLQNWQVEHLVQQSYFQNVQYFPLQFLHQKRMWVLGKYQVQFAIVIAHSYQIDHQATPGLPCVKHAGGTSKLQKDFRTSDFFFQTRTNQLCQNAQPFKKMQDATFKIYDS
jgi:hypothetical protein